MKRKWFHVTALLLAAGMSCSGGGDGGTEPQPKAPVIISGPNVTGLGARGATIQWTTDKECNSVVKYGLSSTYTDSIEVAALVLSHRVDISDLHPLRLYHYKVASDDADGRRVDSQDATFLTLSPVGDLLEEGWTFFQQAKWDSALARFEAAYGYEPDDVGVLEALGWTLLRLYRFESAQPQDLSARSVLEDALRLEPGRVDCLVAVAFLYQALELYQDAILAATEALDLGGEGYAFAHDAEITASDVRYCLLLSLVATGDFARALEEARLIDPRIDLDPEDATTWDGHASFEEALLVIIESLRSQV